MFKNVWAVVLGAISAIVVVSLGEAMLPLLYSFPANVDINDKAAVGKMIAAMPVAAFLLLLLIHVLAAFAGGVVASLASKRVTFRPPLIVGVILIISAIINMIKLPHPVWFMVANIAIYIPFVYFGYMVVRKK